MTGHLSARLERLEAAMPSKDVDVKVKVTVITTQEEIAEVRKKQNIAFEDEVVILSITDD
jgi:hypothetical protein